MVPASPAPAHLTAAPPPLGTADCAALAGLARRLAGIALDETKGDFFVARLGGRLASLRLADWRAYLRVLEDPRGDQERRHFVESLTTHTTSFFRERVQYDWLHESGLPELIGRGIGRRAPLIFWSAACSSGQELYSALMIAADLLGTEQGSARFDGLGTDLSQRILARAERAVYSADEIAGIPEASRRTYLLRSKTSAETFRIVPDLRSRARWSQANLTGGPGLPAGGVHVAFLRNVLIYFDAPTRDRVLRTVVQRIGPGGYLLSGHSETVEASRYGLCPVRPSIYRKD